MKSFKLKLVLFIFWNILHVSSQPVQSLYAVVFSLFSSIMSACHLFLNNIQPSFGCCRRFMTQLFTNSTCKHLILHFMTIDVNSRRAAPLLVISNDDSMLTFLKFTIIKFFLLIQLFVLLQAIACYLPKFLWDAFEGGLLRMIVMGLNLGICREEEKQAKKEVILSYLTSHLKVNHFFTFKRDIFADHSNERHNRRKCRKRTEEIKKKTRMKPTAKTVKSVGISCMRLIGYIINSISFSIAYFLCRRWQVHTKKI